MTAPATDLLAQLIERKLDCLSQLRRMGEKQLDLVRDDRITELLDLLAAKQRLLADLGGIERRLDPFRNQDPDKRQWSTPGARQACAQKLRQCETLLGQIISQEKESEGQLTRRRDEVAARLQGANLASRARGAYTAVSPPQVSQIDLLSEQ
jgi:hypothetical protein